LPFPPTEPPNLITSTGSTADAPGLSVIVPARNARLHLPRCLDALANSTNANFEIIVVNDCSTDDTERIAERYGAHCLRTPFPMGPGGARNLGAEQAKGAILVFVDADVVVPPDALSVIAAGFTSDPELAALFGSYDSAPAWSDFLSQYKNLMHHYVHQNSSVSAVTFWAGCGGIRKSVFQDFGGFDAVKYPEPSIEDIALGHKLTLAGRKILLDKRIEVKHLKRWTLRSLLRADILCRAVPWSKLILESRETPRDLNLTYAARLSGVLVLGLAAGCMLLVLILLGVAPIPSYLVLIAIGAMASLTFALNWKVYQFFFTRRGWWFAARAVPAHWFYYFYSSTTFLCCAVAHYSAMPFASGRNLKV
jgi:glycosyltransferase involved in cell wall biosynthesis